MTREEFDTFYVKHIPEMRRYLGTIFISKHLSQSRTNLRDIINDTYINIYNLESAYRPRTPIQLKAYIFQALKWNLYNNLYKMNRSCTLIKTISDDSNIQNEFMNDCLESSKLSHIDDQRLDINKYINLIKSFSNEKESSYYLEYIELRGNKLTITNNDAKYLYEKYNITPKQANTIQIKFKYYLRNYRKPLANLSFTIEDLSEKQKKIAYDKREIIRLFKKGVKQSDIAKKIGVHRTSVYHTLKRIQSESRTS
jgi:sugar-specific transcriptional regulator TrmB